MFFKRKPSTNKLVEKEVQRLIVVLSQTTPGSAEYTAIVDSIDKLSGLRKGRSETFQRIAPTIIGVIGNLSGILIMMNYERLHIITTKALNLAYKPKGL